VHELYYTAGFAQHSRNRARWDEADLPRISAVPCQKEGGRITSVQTAVMRLGGVRSYIKLNGVKFAITALPIPNPIPNPSLRLCPGTPIISGSPNSLFATPSKTTLSPNLYVSTQATTGTLCSFASIATSAVPERE